MEGSGRDLLKELSQQLYEMTDENRNILRVAGFRVENPCRTSDYDAAVTVTTPQRLF